MERKMYKLWSINGLFVLLLWSLSSCDAPNEYEEQFEVQNKWAIIGPDEVDAGGGATYRTRYEEGTVYTWTITGAGSTIKIGEEGEPGSTVMEEGAFFVDAVFGGVNATLTVEASGNETNMMEITVETSKPTVTASFRGGGPLKSGSSDIVDLEFSHAVTGVAVELEAGNRKPVMGAAAGTAPAAGTVGAVMSKDEDEFFFMYTAGAGDGTVAFTIKNARAATNLGGETMDQATTATLTVDNTAPTVIADRLNAYAEPNFVNDDSLVSMRVTVRLEVSEVLKLIAVRLDEDDDPVPNQMPAPTPQMTIESSSFNNIEDETDIDITGTTITYTFIPKAGMGAAEDFFLLPEGSTGAALNFSFTVKLVAEDPAGNPMDSDTAADPIEFSQEITIRGFPAPAAP